MHDIRTYTSMAGINTSYAIMFKWKLAPLTVGTSTLVPNYIKLKHETSRDMSRPMECDMFHGLWNWNKWVCSGCIVVWNIKLLWLSWFSFFSLSSEEKLFNVAVSCLIITTYCIFYYVLQNIFAIKCVIPLICVNVAAILYVGWHFTIWNVSNISHCVFHKFVSCFSFCSLALTLMEHVVANSAQVIHPLK